MITLMGFMFLTMSAFLGYNVDILTSVGLTSAKMGSFCAWIVALLVSRLLTLSMGNKLEEQVPPVRWENFLIMDVMLLRVRLSRWPLGTLRCVGGILSGSGSYQPFPSTVLRGNNYFTNTLILPVINGPTEGLMLIYMTHFFTAFVGAEWWVHSFGKSIPFLSWMPLINEVTMYKAVLFFMTTFAVIPTVAFNVQNVHKVVKARKGSMLLALAMLYPFVVLLGGVLVWDYLSPTDVMGNYPHLVVVGSGLAFGFLVGRMILAHLCDEPKGLKTNMCMSLFYLPFAIANALTALLNDGVPLVDEFWVLVGYCVYTAFLYLHFATSVIHEITSALGIYCFSW
ncbi:hypothetical protein OROGR_002036 [Orobanche gracilis]